MTRSACLLVGLLAAAVLDGLARSPVLDARTAEPARVLIVQPESVELPAIALIEQGVRQALREAVVPEPRVYVEYLDSRRLPELSRDDALAQWLGYKYRDNPPDLIVSVSSLPLSSVLHPDRSPWPQTPIVFCAVSEDELAGMTLPPWITGVTHRFAVRETPGLVRQLLPDVRRIVAPYGRSSLDLGYREDVRAGMRELGDLRYEEWNDLNVDSMQARLREAPADAAIVILTLDGANATPSRTPYEMFGILAEASTRPVFVFHRHVVGTGVVGGLVVDARDLGFRTGQLAARYLSGEPISALPVESIGPPMPVFDGRQLRRFAIARSSLPAESIVLFDEVPVLERYRWHIAGGAAVLALQAALIGVLLAQRRRRLRLEHEHQVHLQEMAHLDRVAALGVLATSLAHELNQPLTAILTNAQAAQVLLDGDAASPADLREALADIVDDDRRAGDIIHRMRRLLKKGDVASESVDLNAVARDAIRLVSSRAARERIAIDADLSAAPLRVVGDSVQLQQVVVNLLVNAVDASRQREGGDRRVVLRTSIEDGVCRITVRDFGPGINPAELANLFRPFVSTKHDGLGMGLSISRAIVEAHGGKIWAEQETTGVSFHVTLSRQPARENGTKVP